MSVVINLESIPLSLEIENVVASVSFNQNFDLDILSRMFPTAKYNPDEFPGLIYHYRKPKVSMLIFRSGKVVCSGMKSERQARKAATKIFEELKPNGIVLLNAPYLEIENIVVTRANLYD